MSNQNDPSQNPVTFKSHIDPDNHIAVSKSFRQLLDGILQGLKNANRKSRERSIAITKTQEAIMWLGIDLKAINEESPGSPPNPYPESYNPASPKIEPTSEGLKL